MAGKIIWTNKAEVVFAEILEFYCKRNGSNTYSRKLNLRINQIVSKLKIYPFIGKQTNIPNVRIIIDSSFKIIYKLENEVIIILMVWDCRQNPGKMKF